MRSTLIDIAREAGVSAATVDRVLNNRAGVRGRTREIVIETAQRLGYISRRARLAPQSPAEHDPPRFRPAGRHQHLHQDAARAVERARRGAAGPRRPRSIRSRASIPIRWPRTLHDLRGKTDGVGVIALDHPTVREAIRALSANGVKVVTLATDILHVPRVAYVGIDNRAGRPAGRLCARPLPRHRPSRRRSRCSPARCPIAAMRSARWGSGTCWPRSFRTCTIVELREMRDDREKAYAEAAALLDRYDDLAGIYNIGAGNQGIARALQRAKPRTLGRVRRPRS